MFLSTLSLRRATDIHLSKILPRPVSIHALLAESDFTRHPIPISTICFYPRSPCGERPYIIGHAVNLHPVSIHALLAESDNGYPHTRRHDAVSIHALLAESDDVNKPVFAVTSVSIHALLAESDLTTDSPAKRKQWFLSTLSLRRATQKSRRPRG